AGAPAVLQGSTIHLASTSVLVDDVCSGLRTLIALCVLAAVFAYLEPRRARAALMIALAVPIAVLANLVRILILCGFAAYGAPVATARTRDVPARLGAWQGTDLPIDARVHDLLETDDVLLRRYRSAADLVDVLVVHAADSRKVAHPPEICFAGGGFVARDNGY